MKTLDGLLSSAALYYKDLQSVLQKKLGPGTIQWNMHYSSYFHNGLKNIYNDFNRGIYSLYTNQDEILKGNVLLKNIIASPSLSFASISTVIPYNIYTTTFQNIEIIPKEVTTPSLQETITNTVQTQVTARYNLGSNMTISMDHSFSIPVTNIVKTAVPIAFKSVYNLSKKTSTTLTTSNTLMIHEQKFTVRPMTRLIIDILLFKVYIPSTDILLQAEMFGPINISPESHNYLSGADVYTVFHTFNTVVPNIYFNKPDPYIFDHAPLELITDERTVKLNSRGLLQAVLTSHQYIIHTREIPLVQKHDNDFITHAHVKTGRICENQICKFKNTNGFSEDLKSESNGFSKKNSVTKKKQKKLFCSGKCFFLYHTQPQYLCPNSKCKGY